MWWRARWWGGSWWPPDLLRCKTGCWFLPSLCFASSRPRPRRSQPDLCSRPPAGGPRWWLWQSTTQSGVHTLWAWLLIPTRRAGGALPRWLGGTESACQCRRHRFGPWSGEMPAEEQLSPCTAATEPGRCNPWSPCTPQPRLRNQRSHYRERLLHLTSRVAPARHN